MGSYYYSELAVSDISEIVMYIAEDNPEAAYRVNEAIDETAQLIAENPEIGHDTPSNIPHLKMFPVNNFPNYLLFYQITEPGACIQRVFHGARDTHSLLNG